MDKGSEFDLYVLILILVEVGFGGLMLLLARIEKVLILILVEVGFGDFLILSPRSSHE